MNIFTKKDLRQITGPQKSPCVSIYMPTERAGKETRKNPIRLKNALSDAKSKLPKYGLDEDESKVLLKPAMDLQEDTLFWRYQSDGLALFLSKDFFVYHRLPLEFEELVVAADQFHIKPLLVLLSGDGIFFILALSQNRVKFFQATRDTVDEVEIESLPRNMDEALGYDSLEKQVQFHTGTPQTKGKREAIFHGHGAAADIPEEFLLRYLREIDKALHPVLRDEKAPLCVAAVEYMIPLYKNTSSYSFVLDEGIEGNPENLRPDELHKKAWDIVEPLFLKEQRKAAETYHNLARTEKSSQNLPDVVTASVHGRAAILFVAVGVQKWGMFDPDTNKVTLSPEKKPYEVDLLDYAAVHTLLNGGTVYAVKPEKVPGGGDLAAIYRY